MARSGLLQIRNTNPANEKYQPRKLANAEKSYVKLFFLKLS